MIHRSNLHPDIIQQCQQLFFRQSFIKDYLTCPKMALYRWVINMQSTPPMFAAILGTAGHAVIRHMHETRIFCLSKIDLSTLFTQFFQEEIEVLKSKAPPTGESPLPAVPAGHANLDMAMYAVMPDYLAMLDGYQKHDRNRDFHTLLVEQAFVLVIPGVQDPRTGITPPPYLFSGTIDQAGIYGDGTYTERDIKFRDSAFRPSRDEFDLDIQQTIYAAALAYGVPACGTCRPKYVQRDVFDLDPQLTYLGPCEVCKAKIGTPAWPQNFPTKCELVWMRDFNTYESNEYAEFVTDRSANKVINPKTGHLIMPRVPNPRFASGYKIGDQRGPGFIPTYRPPASLDILMSDVLAICDQIRAGVFYRLPGKHCNFWCGFTDQCVKGVETVAEAANLTQIGSYEEPF